tara:strand:+ start:2615 stop:2773 length:159 start_codon:yes stop_codon:yes gene_type:complete
VKISFGTSFGPESFRRLGFFEGAFRRAEKLQKTRHFNAILTQKLGTFQGWKD